MVDFWRIPLEDEACAESAIIVGQEYILDHGGRAVGYRFASLSIVVVTAIVVVAVMMAVGGEFMLS